MQIVISSGKGGVGKSMLTSALAMLFAKKNKIMAVDCDVDAPNLAVWLGEPRGWEKTSKISTSEKAQIDNNKVSKKQAQQCLKKCRFNALYLTPESKLEVNSFLCEGCGACKFFCPQNAATMKPVKNGEIKIKQTKYGFPLVAGQLYPGETGSGKIVTEIKKSASALQNGADTMLIDSAPGTGCPTKAALRDADFVVLVTEPTPSALSDLKRVLQVVEHFQIARGLVLNKWDINPDFSRKIEQEFQGKLLGKISYDKKIFKAVARLTPIMQTNLKAKKEIKEIYNNLLGVDGVGFEPTAPSV